jgi:hypothetical protein
VFCTGIAVRRRSEFRWHCYKTRITLPPTVERRVCRGCHTVLTAGANCDVRIVGQPRVRTTRRGRRGSGGGSGGAKGDTRCAPQPPVALGSVVIYGCRRCGRESEYEGAQPADADAGPHDETQDPVVASACRPGEKNAPQSVNGVHSAAPAALGRGQGQGQNQGQGQGQGRGSGQGLPQSLAQGKGKGKGKRKRTKAESLRELANKSKRQAGTLSDEATGGSLYDFLGRL